LGGGGLPSISTLATFGNGFRQESVAMLDALFINARMQARCRRSWLREPIDDFVTELAGQGYSRSTLRLGSYRLLALGEFMARQGVKDVVALPAWIAPFVAQRRAGETHRQKLGLALRRFVRHLQRKNLVPVSAPPAPAPHADLVEDYLRRLIEHCGLRPDSLVVMRRPCQALMSYVAATNGDLGRLRPETLHGFLIEQATRCNRGTLRSRCYVLRDFLSYLFRRGVIAVDLAAAVVTPRVYRHEQCPRFLTRAEIEAVLAGIDRETAVGRRDYAMLMLLATYGLRGAEVIQLGLGDIDWRGQLLHVRNRKAGNSTTYPLSAPVGNAILAYLQRGRPPSRHRQVFLTKSAPFGPLGSADCIANQIRKYLTVAGVRVVKPGTHSFRYSCAQRLFEVGQPLKVIGDYLGHSQPDTTRRYTMIDFDRLRDVALGDGEERL
jgi:integrase/recombinase XerD